MRGADREDALMVGIMRDGKVFFRADQITIEELPARIREGVSQGAERKVYVKADARAKYASVAEVLDGVHDAGIENIGFIVDQRRPSASNPQ
jgi:biopolymer transport protein TolR